MLPAVWQEVNAIATLALAVSSTIAAALAFASLLRQGAAVRKAEAFQEQAERRFRELEASTEAEGRRLQADLQARLERQQAEFLDLMNGHVQRMRTDQERFFGGLAQTLEQGQTELQGRLMQAVAAAEERGLRQLSEHVLRAARQHLIEHHHVGA